MSFCNWLRREIGRRGWMQTEFALKCGVPVNTVRRWTCGIALPAERNIPSIAKALELEFDHVWNLVEAEKSAAA